MGHVLIYSKIITIGIFEITIFLRRGINIVYKKNVKFGKKWVFGKGFYSLVAFRSTDQDVPDLNSFECVPR